MSVKRDRTNYLDLTGVENLKTLEIYSATPISAPKV